MDMVMHFRFKDKTLPVSISELEEILRKAPKDVSYDPHVSGFKLINNILRLGYDSFGLGQKDVISLWFMQSHPKIRFRTGETNMRKIPGSIKCDYITGHTGYTWMIVLPQKNDEVGDTVTVKRDPDFMDLPGYIDSRVGCDSWFNMGTKMLQQAVRKYDLKRWCAHYYEGARRK